MMIIIWFCLFVLDANGQVHVDHANSHNHPANEARNVGERITKRMVQAVQVNPELPTKRIYNNICDNLSDDLDSDCAQTYRFLVHVILYV